MEGRMSPRGALLLALAALLLCGPAEASQWKSRKDKLGSIRRAYGSSIGSRKFDRRLAPFQPRKQRVFGNKQRVVVKKRNAGGRFFEEPSAEQAAEAAAEPAAEPVATPRGRFQAPVQDL
jgi:hypothetical protein